MLNFNAIDLKVIAIVFLIIELIVVLDYYKLYKI